jgi:hypothetical protein
MQRNVLTFRVMLRAGEKSKSGFRTRRVSVDFAVDGESLLEILDRPFLTKSDLMGGLVEGYPDANAATAARLLGRRRPDSPEGRVLLYICPECGDVGCGAFGARIERRGGAVVGRDFAHESAGDTFRSDARLKFTFDARAYRAAIAEATARFSTTSRTRRKKSASPRRAGRGSR